MKPFMRFTALSLFTFLLVFVFQNCANQGSVTNNVTAQSVQGATYSEIESKILVPKCQQCHHAGLEFGGLNVTSYQRVMGFVKPGDPMASLLYTRQFTTNTFTLTTQESDAIKTWILNGAHDN